jgi:hypothetical protein
MADKKPAGKPASKPSGGGSSAEGQMLIFGAVAVLIFLIVVPTVMMFFGFTGKYTAVTDNFGEKLSNAFTSFVDTVGFLSIFISLLFVMGMIYAKTRLKEITEAYTARLKALDEIGKPRPIQSSLASNPIAGTEGISGVALPTTTASNPFEQYMQNMNSKKGETLGANSASTNSSQQGSVQVTNPKWIQIEKNMQSHNMSEWRVAILEADILLYEMLSQMGYEGNSIGEILKNVDKANFVTLDDAWKAHRIRNIIAHEGANYELSRDEAERTIRLYKRVFDEFYFV